MKKSKIGGDVSPSLKSTNASTCSSASSFSRSCLSKTPLSRGNHSAGAKRSVRLSPVSVIVDDDRRHKSLQSEISNKSSPNRDVSTKNHNNMNSIRSVINEELMEPVMDQNRRVEEVARDLLRNYQRKNQNPHVKHETDRICLSEDVHAHNHPKLQAVLIITD
ncbi:hypothetical protein SASPL_123782 [Salvia splendens]|uniref:Uncharacterized protein n=1 Tax=Salvia splendens TaxID=180675 RepID=A0A8X8ZUB1_SALSN|nr:hypothetical protein SASPL_123782 [Salvia splendens]